LAKVSYAQGTLVKKAFTILELIVVIVIITILSFYTAPKFYNNNLYKAADQIVSHIRYTQHLAMVDNKFDPLKEDWFKKRWQLFFTRSSDRVLGKAWSYIIFSDSFSHTGKPDPSEIAVDPFNNNKRLTGGYTSGGSGIQYSDDRATKRMNIEREYGIKDVLFSNCGSRAKRVSFDHMGRPYYGDLSSLNNHYDRRIKKQCKITICLKQCKISSNDEKVIIAIEPETGYVHILR